MVGFTDQGYGWQPARDLLDCKSILKPLRVMRKKKSSALSQKQPLFKEADAVHQARMRVYGAQCSVCTVGKNTDNDRKGYCPIVELTGSVFFKTRKDKCFIRSNIWAEAAH